MALHQSEILLLSKISKKILYVLFPAVPAKKLNMLAAGLYKSHFTPHP
jgi:hypothetical protein